MLENLEGQTFGRLVVLRRAENKGKRTFWACRCICGKEVDVWAANLKLGTTKSCGCWYKESRQDCKKTHGQSSSGTYRSWRGAKDRCYNPNNKKWSLYGGKGITVCDEWKNSFEQFVKDMGERPEAYSLGRIDSNKNYCSDNCRWETIKEQNRNTTQNIWLEYQGKTETCAYWCNVLGIRCGTMSKWIKKGKTLYDIIPKIQELHVA